MSTSSQGILWQKLSWSSARASNGVLQAHKSCLEAGKGGDNAYLHRTRQSALAALLDSPDSSDARLLGIMVRPPPSTAAEPSRTPPKCWSAFAHMASFPDPFATLEAAAGAGGHVVAEISDLDEEMVGGKCTSSFGVACRH